MRPRLVKGVVLGYVSTPVYNPWETSMKSHAHEGFILQDHVHCLLETPPIHDDSDLHDGHAPPSLNDDANNMHNDQGDKSDADERESDKDQDGDGMKGEPLFGGFCQVT